MLTFLAVLLIALVTVLVASVALTGWTAWSAKRLVPPCGRFICVDGIRLHVLDIGEGPAIVMLHGLAAQLQTFTYALTRLLGGRYRLVLVDRPGCGYSEPACSATLRAQAAIIAALMRQLDLGPSVIVGHSLGGAVALALALERPESVSALALIAPATLPQDDVPRALRVLAIRRGIMRWLVSWTVAVPLGLLRRKATMHLLFSPDPVPDDFAVAAGAILATRPKSFRNACRDLVEAGGDLAGCAERYCEITVPVGVLYGSGDRILDGAWHGDGLKGRIANLVLEFIPGGHMTPITDPDRSARFIEAVVARAASEKSAVA